MEVQMRKPLKVLVNMKLQEIGHRLLQQCISQSVVNIGLILTEPSMESSNVDGLEPYTGMTFPSLDDARDSVVNMPSGQRRPSRCKALTEKRQSSSSTSIYKRTVQSHDKLCKFVQEHNHKLMTHCKFLGELPAKSILGEEEKDKKIQDLYDELQREREQSAAFQQQLSMIIQDLKEHEEFMSLRVEDIVNTLKEIELGDL
uniref:Uncharacterized protein n=1 Tax=Populus trichocarpa TaxID=3694 RepID=A0A2K1R5X4_POPTR